MTYLVSCVSQKLNHPAPARDLYCSRWFLLARDYIRNRAGRWFILSAKYGLLDPDRVIEPYEVTLVCMEAKERLKWAQSVISQLAVVLEPHEPVVILAGNHYREHLVPWLSSRGHLVKVPMGGLPIGKQLAWMMKQLRTP